MYPTEDAARACRQGVPSRSLCTSRGHSRSCGNRAESQGLARALRPRARRGLAVTLPRPTHRAWIRGPVWVALLAAATPGGTRGAVPQREVSSKRPAMSLAEVRAVFGRADADHDGLLDRREADQGGVAAEALGRFDLDGDGHLNGDEYVVASHTLLASGERLAAHDLLAESTRIQASWRARRTSGGVSGPSSRLQEARRARGTGSGVPGETTPVIPRDGPPIVAPGRPDPAGATTADAGAPPGAPPPGLGLSRLRQVAGGESDPEGVTLEERARAAQELIQARLGQGAEGGRAPIVVSSRRGPGSRVRGVGANGSAPPVRQAPPAGRSTNDSRASASDPSPRQGDPGPPPDRRAGPGAEPRPSPSPAQGAQGGGAGPPAPSRSGPTNRSSPATPPARPRSGGGGRT